MNEFEVVTVIGRPAKEGFAVVQDVTRTPLWTPGLSEVRRTSGGENLKALLEENAL